MAIGLIAGCASAPDIPVPVTTNYDGNPEARRAYLDAYRMGYRCGLSGRHVAVDTFGGDSVSSARSFGSIEGELAGAEAADLQHKKERALREAKTE